MSAPESTSSKGRPSLLSETAPGAGDNSSRILASLEGRAVAQPLPRRRPKKPLMIAALALVGFGALGAWQLQRGQQGESTATAAAPATRGTAVGAGAGKAQATGGASAAVTAAVANASGVSALVGGASTSQAAVIVADDSTRADTSVAAASSPSGNGADSDRLSRALASGVAPTLSPSVAVAPGAQPAEKSASTAVAAVGSASSTNAVAKRAAPAVASRTDRQTVKSRHPEKVASAHGSKRVKGHASSVKDDPDADLLAALVARTKPYEPKASSANAPKGAGGATTKAARPAADAHRTSLADQVKACDKGNFFEAQACRWRVCSDHWGKDPACPSTAAAAQTH